MGAISIIPVTVGTDVPVSAPQDFRAVLVLTDINQLRIANGFTDRIRYYTTPRQVNDEGGAVNSALKALVGQMLTQQTHVQQVALGRWDTGETVDAALDAIRAASDEWYGLTLAVATSADTIVEDIAAWAEINKKFHMGQTIDADNLTVAVDSTIDVIRDNAYKYSAWVHSSANNNYVAANWLSRFLSVNPDQQSSVAAFKNLSGVTPSALTQTEQTAVLGANGNFYGTLKGTGVTYRGRMGDGSPMDQRLTIDWFEDRVQRDIAQLLIDTSNRNEKIPFTQAGLQQLASTLDATLQRGVAAGHFTAGTTQVIVPDVSTLDKTTRQATIEFSAEFAGAVEDPQYTGAIVADIT